MFTKNFLTTRMTLASTVALVAFGVSLFVFQAPFVQAATTASSNGVTMVSKALTTTELQTLIAQLQNQLRELNSSIATTSTQFSIGKEVEITDTLRVRGSASTEGRIIGLQKSGAKGVVVEGPVSRGGQNWVKVDYESGPDGWNAANWLKNRTSPSKPVETAFNTVVSGLKATVSFTVSNGCGGYIISWGDDTKTELAGSPAGSRCTMAIVNVTKDHIYAKAGTYKVKVERLSGSVRRDVSEKEIRVGSEARQDYTLTDVSKITKQYIDPSLAIADEEFTQYSITLKSGRKIEVKVYGRTVPGTTEEAFRKTGFIGDISMLMSRARELPATVGTPKSVATTTPTIIFCTNGLRTHVEGDKLQSLTEGSQTRSIADASFVCRSGKWVVEGSLPKPIKPDCVKGKPGYTASTGRTTAECLGSTPDDIKASTTVPGVTPIVCAYGLDSYPEGTKKTSILNANGSQSMISDGSYVCRGGKWVIEGSLPKASTTPGTLRCTSGIATYEEGSKLQTITENGQTRTIADASFVCRAGKWAIEGSLPKPVNPECIKVSTGSFGSTRPSTAECSGTTPVDTSATMKSCTLKTTLYKHGESAQFAQASGGSSRPSTGALVNHVCQNGEWKPVAGTSTQTSVGGSSTSNQSGVVRGVSTDIMTEISVTLLNIKNILSGII